MDSWSHYFIDSYEEGRERLRGQLPGIQARWPQARLAAGELAAGEDLTIDWIWAPARQANHTVLMVTTGEHGIEGFVGSAMLQLLVEEFLPQVSPDQTGLLLVHAINPWGMKHRRRVNASNVDLNRNFILGGEFDERVNEGYSRLDAMLNPVGAVNSLVGSSLAMAGRVARAIAGQGSRALAHTILLGQYRFPRGIYYGGQEHQEETRVLMDLYQQVFTAYQRVLLLDMHTGFGPRYQMSLVNSSLESESSPVFARRFDYPLVVKADPDEFYSIQGDMIDYVYRLRSRDFPRTQLYGTSFEFGTLGDSTLAALLSMRAMILENQAFWYGAGPAAADKIQADFEALYYPLEAGWREKAVADSRRAFKGILQDFKLI